MASGPSPKNLVWPVGSSAMRGGWDPDQPHLAGSPQPGPYHTIHIPYDPLTTPKIAFDPDGTRYPLASELQGRLAESWESADGDATWTVRVRQGVRSHAGNELTAEDVVWMVQRVFALRGVGLWRLRRLAAINAAEDVEAVDRYTVRFRLRGANPQFPQYLLFASGNVVDSTEARRHATDEDPWATAWLSRNACGFGQFSVVGQNDEAIEFSARDEHWMGRPGVDSIVQVGVDGREQGLRMLDSGEANMALGLYPEELARFERRPEFITRKVRGPITRRSSSTGSRRPSTTRRCGRRSATPSRTSASWSRCTGDTRGAATARSAPPRSSTPRSTTPTATTWSAPAP